MLKSDLWLKAPRNRNIFVYMYIIIITNKELFSNQTTHDKKKTFTYISTKQKLNIT